MWTFFINRTLGTREADGGIGVKINSPYAMTEKYLQEYEPSFNPQVIRIWLDIADTYVKKGRLPEDGDLASVVLDVAGWETIKERSIALGLTYEAVLATGIASIHQFWHSINAGQIDSLPRTFQSVLAEKRAESPK